ncbi:MAG: cytochrome b/b6 domain-containing protein [Rhodospirillaceae bacterium]|nr:cytochrome b/b6 domain-containing protein [Rhodospirillaceae bacterium]
MAAPSAGDGSVKPPVLRNWDRFVRLAHWLFVIGFATAYFTADEVEDVHYIVGYSLATLVLLRILWGFVGPRRARFSDFVYGPIRVLRYFADLVRFRSERYVGHSPAGGAMVVALLVMLAAIIGTGMARLAIEEGEGPLAFWLAAAPPAEAVSSLLLVSDGDDQQESEKGEDREDDGDRDEDRDEQRDGDEDRREDSEIGEVHEFLANAMLFLIGAHIGGVLLASFAHRENLVIAMFTGRKRGGDAADL